MVQKGMEYRPIEKYRYGLATLLVRRPHLRCHAKAAHWWSDVLENYADAIRVRDRLRAEGDDSKLIAEYEELCHELEDELEGYFTAAG
ncbi:hypothetical protein NXC24_PA00149 (plasmid) [Rhizobium sp. NXC24]|nr:hypothetical protein NXC24_PA00149 [Rhizobium sp. NXC24]